MVRASAGDRSASADDVLVAFEVVLFGELSVRGETMLFSEMQGLKPNSVRLEELKTLRIYL